MIALDHFCPLAPLLLELERRLEEIDVQARRVVKARHHMSRLDAVEATVADEPGDCQKFCV
jgi:hypothetical protein